ncbi:DUF3016 domain-containing protein [Variovorax sp. J22R133]|uniref:DUF3016 domain-containing protein n=1 Tax=Variovorax brevis TaxID=3053503 RepID=UPI002575E148|nr:DUF3016 domain-containing protein [Variovorax sp. J22R133]MDM0111392.1 DUF3016 domain-containing protein [Variovorax sp. J22R133]
MARFNRLAGAALFAALASSAAMAAQLSVVFINPERFRDAAYSRPYANANDLLAVQRDMERHLKGLADRGLPPGDSLRIEVLDIDLAGEFNPFWPRTGHLRIVRDIYWPRIKLRYTLTHGDQTMAGAEEELSDMNFLMTVNPYSEVDRFRYEKPMLDDWFARRFGARQNED